VSATGDGRSFLGKYRGTVINNVDPMQLGRLLVEVPDVLGLVPSSWAVPCVPLAGPTGPPMGIYMVPPVGAGVWVEFEQGDPNYPVWVGCRWGSSSDIPAQAKAGVPVAPNIVVQSLTQNRIVISSVPGDGIIVETAAGELGPRIVLTTTALKLTCGPLTSVELSFSDVKINGQALVVSAV
jgi:Type VI secretion system/phage-baseplate injector OB domain